MDLQTGSHTNNIAEVKFDLIYTFYILQMFQSRVRQKFGHEFRFNPRRFAFFSYIFPYCIFSHSEKNKVSILNSLFLWLWPKEIGWIIPQPSSTFDQDHSACTLNSIDFLCVWNDFQTEELNTVELL